LKIKTITDILFHIKQGHEEKTPDLLVAIADYVRPSKRNLGQAKENLENLIQLLKDNPSGNQSFKKILIRDF
jgi:hypothetical protein